MTKRMKEEERIPCQIHEGKYCNQPLCRFIYYRQLSEIAYREWIQKCREELAEFKRGVKP